MFSCSLCGYEFTYKQALSIGSRLGRKIVQIAGRRIIIRQKVEGRECY